MSIKKITSKEKKKHKRNQSKKNKAGQACPINQKKKKRCEEK